MPAADHLIDDVLRGLGRHGDDGNRNLVPRSELAQIPDIENRHARARFLSDFAWQRVEQRGNLKAFLLEARIVGKREAEVAGAEDGDLAACGRGRESAAGAA